jgi:hypothetical protein
MRSPRLTRDGRPTLALPYAYTLWLRLGTELAGPPFLRPNKGAKLHTIAQGRQSAIACPVRCAPEAS